MGVSVLTYYDILQVSREASDEVIQMAYRALAKKYHPDLYNGDKEFATKKMQQINEAYRVLSSQTLRSEYDQKLKQSSQQTNTQSTYNTTYQSQHTYEPPKPKSTKEKIIEGIKKVLLGILKFLWLCLANFKITLGVIVLFFIFLNSIGVFDGEKTTTSTSTSNSSNSSYSYEETLPKVAEPVSGTILSGYEYNNGSEITITASGSSSCVVKLKTSSGVTRLSFYVRSGDTVTVGVPAEHLYVYFAAGEDWYGTKHLFGKNTSYSKDKNLCDFTEYTWEYTLRPVTNGNFSQTTVSADEFN